MQRGLEWDSKKSAGRRCDARIDRKCRRGGGGEEKMYRDRSISWAATATPHIVAIHDHHVPSPRLLPWMPTESGQARASNRIPCYRGFNLVTLPMVLSLYFGPAVSQSPCSDEAFSKWLVPIVIVLNAFSAALGEGIGLVNSAVFSSSESRL